MAIFQIKAEKIESVKLSDFKTEKEIQKIVEGNLEVIFNCRFVATEFSTGSIHAGRIDTLALSEDSNPVIIEYKKVASSELINQSLYYLHWITDHKGDFQVAASKVLKPQEKIDWSEVRVICIAPDYKKYDLHAVKVMGANIELWQYKLYDNGILNLEEVFRRTESSLVQNGTDQKNPKMVEAGKKAALTRREGVYSTDEHLRNLGDDLKDVFEIIRDYVISLSPSVEETPKQDYISYKTSQNFVCLETRRDKLLLFLKINSDDVQPLPSQCRDVRNIGHYGTGNLEVTIRTIADFEKTKTLIDDSLKNIGG